MSEAGKKITGEVVRFILKIAIAAAVVGWLVSRNFDRIAATFREFDYLWLIPALLFYALHIGVAAWRWRELAKVQKVLLSGMEAFSLTMQGYFFSLVIPGGAVGGDVVKMSAVSRRLPDGARTGGAFSVLMDRIVGMLGLFIPALLMIYPGRKLLAGISGLPDYLDGNVLAFAVAGLCVAGIAAAVAVLCHRRLERLFLVSPLLNFLDRCSKGMVTRVLDAADLYRGNLKLLAKMVLVSVPGVHFMTVIPMYFLLAGTGAECHWFVVVIALFVGNIAGLIPLFPGGIGGRDLVVIALLISGGVPGAAAETAQLLYTGVMMICYAAGGLFFIFDPGRKLRDSGGGK